MYKLLVTCLLLFSIISLNAQNNYTIKGKISPRLNYRIVKLTTYADDSIKDVQETIIKNGEFFFTGPEYLESYSKISFSDYQWNEFIYSIILERGDIGIDIKDFDIKVSGTPLNNLWQDFSDLFQASCFRMSELSESKKVGVITEDSFYVAAQKHQDFIKDFVINNIGNVVGKQWFTDNCNRFWENDLYQILAISPPEVQFHPNVLKVIESRADEFQKRENELKIALNPYYFKGQKMMDFEFFTLDGKKVHLSDYIGKSNYLYLDCWASWCGPCIKDMPELKKVYEKYRKDGLEIISISFDDIRPSWEKAVPLIDVPWLHLSQLQTHPPFKGKYSMRTIPNGILLDKNGTILGTGCLTRADYLQKMIVK